MQSWVDLSAYGLKLSLVRTPNGQHKLVIQGLEDAIKRHKTDSVRLGFRPHANNPQLLLRDARVNELGALEEVISISNWRAVFPQAAPDIFEKDRHYIAIESAKPAASADAKPVAGAGTVPTGGGPRVLTGGRSVGMNRFGQEVLELDGERYVKDPRGQSLSERDGGAPALFLRGLDAEQLALCAEGFLEQAVKGRIQRAPEFDRFVETIGWKGDVTVVADAVRGALARHLAKRGGRTLSDAFLVAGRLHEALPCLADYGPVPTPAPIAVAAQRVLGLEPGLTGRRIFIEDNGPGYVLSHMPKQADIEIACGSDKLNASRVEASIASAGLKSAKILKGKKLPKDLRGLFADLGTDYDAIQTRINALADDANCVVVIDAPQVDKAGLDEIREKIASGRHFEGEARVDGGLWSGHSDSPEKLVWAIGAKRSEPAEDVFPPVAYPVNDWAAMWSWTAKVVSDRAREADREIMAAQSAVSLNKGADPSTANSFQAPYVSASRLGKPSTMVPRNLEGATREALARIVRLHGDIDAYVAREYHYSLDDMKRIFSPEQIDAMALWLHADKRERGMLIGDQTGVGKGRALAAIMRRAAILGEQIHFFTERQQNLSDIWRDIVHTESAHFFTPLVMNDSAEIIDEATKQVVLRGAPRDEIEVMLESGAWPTGVNLILGTYSQYNRDVEEAVKAAKISGDNLDLGVRKSRWISTAITDNVLIVADECHNAASQDSNVGGRVRAAINSAGNAVFSSATFAKNSMEMAFYRKLLPAGLSDGDLEVMMERGGETFQEVFSSMLVKDGVMIRREFDLSRVTYRTFVDTQRFDRNRGYMDAVAPILTELMRLNEGIDERIRNVNDAAMRRAPRRAGAELDEDGQAADAPRGKKAVAPYKLTRSGFGSPVFTISRLFVASLRIDAVVEEAINALNNNKKPIVVVENTVQTLMEELADKENDADGVVVADFRALFYRILRKMTHSQYRDEHNEMHRRDMTAGSPQLTAAVDRIRRLIDDMPDLPASAIDEVKRRINETGYTCDEITGRTLEIRDGRIMRRPSNKSNNTVIKNSFNSGEIDALIINASGSTGIDLHAGSRFADQRKRVMLELQPPVDIRRKIQGHGRVNRYDQVEDPEIVSFICGLPIETRLAAMENAHLRRMSANTTSNRDAAQLTRDIPDLINPVGDIVCSRYAEARPDLMRRLGFKVDDIQKGANINLKTEKDVIDDLQKRVKGGKKEAVDESLRGDALMVKDTRRTANEILSRIIMLPVREQEHICAELTAEYNAAIEELEARGETPLRTYDLPGIVHERERSIFDGAEADSNDSVFHEPLYVVTGALQRLGTPIKPDGLMERIQIGEMASGRSFSCVERLRSGMEEILSPYLPHSLTVAEALAKGHKEITRRKEMIDTLAKGLEDIKPGVQVAYTVDAEVTRGIVTRVEYPERGYEHVPGAYGVEFVVPGDEKPRSMRLATLLRDPAFKVEPGLASNDYDKILKKFEQADAMKLTEIRILTGNLYRGMFYNSQYRLGRLVVYKDADGMHQRGIVLSNRHKDLRAIPVDVAGTNMCLDALINGTELVASSTLADKVLSMKASDTTVRVSLPPRNSRKYAFVYDNPKIDEIARRAPTAGDGPVQVEILMAEAREVLDAFHAAGARFYAAPVARKWALEWTRANGAKPKKDGGSSHEPPTMVA